MSHQASAEILDRILNSEADLRRSHQQARVAGLMLIVQVPLLLALSLIDATLAPVNAISALGCIMLILSLRRRSRAIDQLSAAHAQAVELSRVGAWEGPLLGQGHWPSGMSRYEQLLRIAPLIILFYSLLLLFWDADLRQMILSLGGSLLLLLVCSVIVDRLDRPASQQPLCSMCQNAPAQTAHKLQEDNRQVCWLTCNACQDLVQAGDREGLAKRGGDPHLADVAIRIAQVDSEDGEITPSDIVRA